VPGASLARARGDGGWFHGYNPATLPQNEGKPPGCGPSVSSGHAKIYPFNLKVRPMTIAPGVGGTCQAWVGHGRCYISGSESAFAARRAARMSSRPLPGFQNRPAILRLTARLHRSITGARMRMASARNGAASGAVLATPTVLRASEGELVSGPRSKVLSKPPRVSGSGAGSRLDLLKVSPSSFDALMGVRLTGKNRPHAAKRIADLNTVGTIKQFHPLQPLAASDGSTSTGGCHCEAPDVEAAAIRTGSAMRVGQSQIQWHPAHRNHVSAASRRCDSISRLARLRHSPGSCCPRSCPVFRAISRIVSGRCP